MGYLKNTQLRDSRVQLLFCKNRGLTKALNFAIKRANGEYIVRQDGDDVSDRHRLQVLYDVLISLENPKRAIILTSDAVFFDEIQSKFIGKIRRKRSDFWMKFKLRLYNQFSHGTFCFSRELTYNEDYIVAQDYELMIRAVFKLQFEHFHINRVLYLNRIHDNQISSNRKAQLEACYRAQGAIFGKTNVFMLTLRIVIYYVLYWRSR